MYVLFTHSDMDGYGCKLVMEITMKLLEKTDGEYEVIICQNGDVDEKVNEYLDTHSDMTWTNIWFSDISPNVETAERLMRMEKEKMILDVRIFDHHVSSIFLKDIVGENAVIYADEMATGKKECGTSILYMEMAKELAYCDVDTSCIDEKLYAEIVDNIRLYDTYTWKEGNVYSAKQLNTMFSMIGGENFVNKYYKRIMSNHKNDMFSSTELEFINGKLYYAASVINSLTLDDFITTEVQGYRVLLMMKSVAASINEIADYILEKYPDYDVVMNMSMFGTWQVQMRSRKDTVNVADLAVPLGGGGHLKAAGCQIPKELREAVTDTLIKFLNRNEVVIETRCKYWV